MASKPDTSVTVYIAEEEYSLLEPPKETSAVVLRQKKNVTSLNLDNFVKHIKSVGKMLQVAYYGVVGAGPKYTDLQIKIHEIGYNITTLFERSAVTVNSFEETAETVSFRLQSTYEFLIDGCGEEAIESLSSLNEMAEEMKEAAKGLEKEFKKQEVEVKSALKSTQEAHGKSAREKEMEEKKRSEEREKAQQDLINRHQKLMDEARQDRKKWEEKEIEEMDKPYYTRAGTAFVILTRIFSPWAGSSVERIYDKEHEKSLEKRAKYKEKAEEQRKIEEAESKLYEEAQEDMKKFSAAIQKLDDNCTEKELADAVVDALHHAKGALNQLAFIMRQASLFWEEMAKQCQHLANPYVYRLIKIEVEKEKEKFWEQKTFKTEAVRYHAKWIALRITCQQHMLSIQAARGDLYKYIQENPTYSEAREQVKELAKGLNRIINNN